MVKPYYEADGIRIFHGDCAEITPTLGQFDLLCTDPPYGIGEARGKNKSRGCVVVDKRRSNKHAKAPSRDYGMSDWDDVPASDALLTELRACTEFQCIFGGNFFDLPPSPCWLVWDKENGDTDFADCELAWTNYKRAVRRLRYQWHGMLRGGVSGKAAEVRYHPTQKPLAVMSWAIGLCPELPTTVLDPFMGSGTTLRACKDLGISAVGIEREEKYCEIAVRRLAQQTLFGGL